VLNASRHHRKNRTFWLEALVFVYKCSTPRGITGKIALLFVQCDYLSPVLNASRHHRKNRHQDAMQQAEYTRCSTPRGITGKIALTRSSPR